MAEVAGTKEICARFSSRDEAGYFSQQAGQQRRAAAAAPCDVYDFYQEVVSILRNRAGPDVTDGTSDAALRQ